MIPNHVHVRLPHPALTFFFSKQLAASCPWSAPSSKPLPSQSQNKETRREISTSNFSLSSSPRHSPSVHKCKTAKLRKKPCVARLCSSLVKREAHSFLHLRNLAVFFFFPPSCCLLQTATIIHRVQQLQIIQVASLPSDRVAICCIVSA